MLGKENAFRGCNPSTVKSARVRRWWVNLEGDNLSKNPRTGLLGVKAILFDLFDTLLLVRAGINLGESCLKNVYEFLSANGVRVSYEDFRRAYSEVRSRLYERISVNLEEPHYSLRISEVLKRLGYDCDLKDPLVRGAVNAYSEEFVRHICPDEEASLVLSRLYECGYKIGVISNFSIPECARNLIEKYGLREFLDVIVISAEINRRKPSPEIFNFTLNLLGVSVSESIFVGDTPDVDIRGAKNIGMRTVLIGRKNSNISEEDKPDFTIKRLGELLNLLAIENYRI